MNIRINFIWSFLLCYDDCGNVQDLLWEAERENMAVWVLSRPACWRFVLILPRVSFLSVYGTQQRHTEWTLRCRLSVSTWYINRGNFLDSYLCFVNLILLLIPFKQTLFMLCQRRKLCAHFLMKKSDSRNLLCTDRFATWFFFLTSSLAYS